MSWQTQKKKQGDSGGGAGKATKFKHLERPDIDSAIDEAEAALETLKQAEEPKRGRCGCWG